MQRVAIFKFNWGQRLALSLLFILSVLIGALFIYNTHLTHAASNTTYKTETSDNLIKKVKAIKYYSALSYCTSSMMAGKFKTTISGGDIDKGPRWWINGGGTVLLGQYLDNWGDKNGTTDCSGESDDSPGWISDMFSVFGLSTASGESGKVDALEGLGYSCAKNGSDWSCTNNDINSSTSKKGILYQALHGPYLNGVNPLTTQPDFNAMSYVVAMDALTTTSMCKATKGGSSNLVTVSAIQPDGSITKGDWAIQNDGGPGRRVSAGLPLDGTYAARSTNTISCQGAADDTVSFADDYQKWVAGPACAATYPDKADSASFITGCAYGRIHPTDYAACLANTFTANRAVDTVAQDACFIGQGLPVDSSGTPSGRLCANLPKYGADTSLLTACIKGSINRTVTYCQTSYPEPDQIPNRPVRPDTNAATREACIFGTALKVSGGGIPQDAGAAGAVTGDGSSKTSCGIEGIGWIVCPVISFMGDMLASAFSGLADNFLAVNPTLFDTGSGTYSAWSVFRTFANIAFVIVFLIIIFSQLTGVGVSNYGVKKLLPRIVIAAILVNLSYFICQLAVDLSNILGYSLKQVFDGIAVTANVPTSGDASANGFGITAIILAVIATATIAYFALSILIPILLGALVGVLMVVLMLIARKAIIILLIVLSPLAFVAFLLPNTESLFTKWRKAFMALLLLFPIISVVFGASSLASQIILKAGPGTGDITILQIMAVGIASLPFFLVPTLLKGSLNGIGSVGGKLSGFASKMGGGLGKAGGKGFGNSRLGKFQQYRAAERTRRGALIQSGAFKGNYKKLDPRNLRNVASNINAGINDKSGVFGTRLSAGGISAADEEQAKNTKAAAILLNSKGLSRQGLRAELGGAKDPAMHRAIVEKMISTNDITGINSMVENSHTWTPEERIHLADTLGGASNRPAYIGQGTLASMREGGQQNIKNLVKAAVDTNAYSAGKLASGDADELTFVAKTTAEIGGSTQDKIAQAAYDAATDERLAPTIGKNQAQVENLSNKAAPTADQLKSLD